MESSLYVSQLQQIKDLLSVKNTVEYRKELKKAPKELVEGIYDGILNVFKNQQVLEAVTKSQKRFVQSNSKRIGKLLNRKLELEQQKNALSILGLRFLKHLSLILDRYSKKP